MNKNILITGAARRIGKYLALGLADDGWCVVVHYNKSRSNADELVAQINQNGGKAIHIQAELANAKQCDELIDKASHKLNSPITALINNASVFEPDSPNNFKQELFDKHMQVNLKAPIILSEKFANQKGIGKNANIINIIDQAIMGKESGFFSYDLSKTALYRASIFMAKTFAPNIRVNAIAPGPSLKNIYQSDTDFEREVAETLLKTGSPPDSILHAARFLLSATSVTGHIIPVDGGKHLQG